MSFQTLERHILAQARLIANNPSLKLKDICEWSNSEQVIKKNLLPGEVYFLIPGLVVWVCIEKTKDRRRPIPAPPCSSRGNEAPSRSGAA